MKEKQDRLTAQDIEIAVAKYFNFRMNLIVPNVSWGWGLRHEADMIVLRPSGYCDEIEIKVTASDIKADLKKPTSHWENRRILRVWFAVPEKLADNPDIPKRAGILFVRRVEIENGWHDVVGCKRPAQTRSKEERIKINEEQRTKLAELGAMRIWDLKTHLRHNKP